MPEKTIVLKSDAGIKRDGTKFEGNNYTDGQWVRWQRGLPRKIGGYRSTQKYLTEISRGFSNFTQMDYIYCHSGSRSMVERFTIDYTANSSIVSDRTPEALRSSGNVILTGGAAGSVNTITVDGVNIMSGAVSYVTSLTATAAAVVANINAYTSVPNYIALAVGTTIAILSDDTGSVFNGYVVAVTTTVITTTTQNMNDGSNALVADDLNMWMFDYQYDSSTNQNYLLAHVSPNLQRIANDEGGQIFFGEVLGTGILKSINLPPDANCTGGIVSLHPYLFYYGTDGIIGWSVAGEPTNLTDFGSGAGLARVWGQKIIKGLPLRAGSGTAPAGLFWAYDAVIRATFTGGASVFQFDVVATDTSIISENSVVDYDGVFFWAGVDRFLMFNGVVREVPNTMNLNYFFDGLNKRHRSKVFAYKVPRYGEIWWCYPRGDATECTHAVIYNVRENTWYDTTLPANGRSAGAFNNSFAAPILSGAVAGLEATGATGTITLTGGSSGSVNTVTVGGVQIMSGTVPYNTSLFITAEDVANNINSYGSDPDYVATVALVGADPVITLTATTDGSRANYLVVAVTSTTITATTTNMIGGTDDFRVWIQEQGVDEIDGNLVSPIQSYFETADLSAVAQGNNEFMRITRIEPDFVQSGNMTVQVTGRSNARAPEVYGTTFTFPATAQESWQQIVMLKEQRRELRVRFESNEIYGDYQMGQIIGHVSMGDNTVIS
jgi:hypothetical protein